MTRVGVCDNVSFLSLKHSAYTLSRHTHLPSDRLCDFVEACSIGEIVEEGYSLLAVKQDPSAQVLGVLACLDEF